MYNMVWRSSRPGIYVDPQIDTCLWPLKDRRPYIATAWRRLIVTHAVTDLVHLTLLVPHPHYPTTGFVTCLSSNDPRMSQLRCTCAYPVSGWVARDRRENRMVPEQLEWSATTAPASLTQTTVTAGRCMLRLLFGFNNYDTVPEIGTNDIAHYFPTSLC